MKKLLALVLALVMTLGLATVSASAAGSSYADKSDISYLEAADVLSKVGVFEGKGENFAPKDNLNRAEAAKLVAYLMLGNKTAEAIHGNGNRFTDVPADHWAVGYIEYLATAGVVSGVGGGNYNPNGQVTAVQFAKMLNVALGYDAQVEGYVGESWNINIMKQANDDEIFKTLDVSSNDALTREQAAQMCLNALKANVVEYESKGDTLTINNSTVVLNAKKAKDKTTTATKGNAIKDDDAAGTTANPYTLQLGEELYNGDLKMEKTTDDFGRPANKWTYKLEKIDTYVDYGILKAEYTDEIKRGPLYDTLGSSVYDHLVTSTYDTNYASLFYTEDGVTTWVNDSTTAATNKAAVENYIQKNGDKAINSGNSSGRGTLTQVFVDKDDNTYISVVNTYVFKASSDYRASTEDIVVAVPSGVTGINLNSTRLELKDHPQIKDMKKDDYILVTAHHDTPNSVYEVKTADKAELLTAKVDKYVKDDSVTLDGTTYKYDKKIDTTSKGTEYSIGQETTVVLDKYGYIMYVDEAVVSANYVFISEVFQNGGSTSKAQANAYFTDGTNSNITIKEISGLSATKTALATTNAASNAWGVMNNDGNGQADLYAGWYTYSKNSSNEYTLNVLSGGNKEYGVAKSGTMNKLTSSDTVKFINSGATAYATDAFYKLTNATANAPMANDKTIMVVAYSDKNDVDVYTGVKNMPEISLLDATGKASIMTVVNSSNYAKYVFVSLEGKYTVFGTENESLLYVIKYDKKNVISTDTTYYTYKALDENAKEISIESDGSAIFGNDDTNTTVYKAFYKTSKNADGRYTRGQVVPSAVNGTVKYLNRTNLTSTITADNGALNIAGDSFTLANNYKLVAVSKVDALNKKQNTDYEANIVTAEGLAAMVQGYSVTYDIQAKLDDHYTLNNGGKIIEAYVTITKATASGSSTSASSSNGIKAVVLTDDMRGITGGAITPLTDAVTIYYTGQITPTDAEIAEAVSAEFAKYSSMSAYSLAVEQLNNGTYAVTMYQNGTAIGTRTPAAPGDAMIPVGSKETSDHDWDITSDTNLTNLVVPEGVKLTVDGAKVTVTGPVVVAGAVEIKNGGEISYATADITKSGHVDVNGGKWNGNGATKTYIEGDSLVADSSSNNEVDFGTTAGAVVTGKLTIGGGLLAGVVDNRGTTSITGNTVLDNSAAITANGGSTSIASTVTKEAGATVSSSNGGTTKVNGTTVTDASSIGTSGTTTVTLGYTGLKVTSISNVTNDGVDVYRLTSDTAAVEIVLTNNGTNSASLNSVSVTPGTSITGTYTITVDGEEYTSGSKTVAGGNSVTVGVTYTAPAKSKN